MAIVRRLINFCWFFFKWGTLLTIIAGVTAGFYVYLHMDDAVRQKVEALLAQHYPGLRVTIRRAQLVKGQGIEIHGLSISEPGAEGPRCELLFVEEVRLACQTDLQELLSRDPQVTEVLVRRPTLSMTRRPDGTWSTVKLLPVPTIEGQEPAVVVDGGTIEIFDPLKTPSSTDTLRNVNLTLAPSVIADPSGVEPGMRRLRGTLTGDHFRQINLDGLVDPHRSKWEISGAVEGLEVSPALASAMPSPLAERFAALDTLRGEGEVNFRVGFDPAAPQPYHFDVDARLAQGRIDDPRLPHPLTDVRARLRCDNRGYTLDEFSGRSGQSVLRVTGQQTGYEETSPREFVVNVRQLELDRQLFDVLPPVLKAEWYKYLPSGAVDAEVMLSFDGRAWRPQLTLTCLSAAFSFHKFPYRLEWCRGKLVFKDDGLDLNLTALAGRQPVEMHGRVIHLSTGGAGWVTVAGDEIPIDDKLIEALPEKPRAVVRSLAPRGTCSLKDRIEKPAPDAPVSQNLVVTFNRCGMVFDRFPYSLSNVHGTLSMVDGYWTFNQLEGSNGTGRVTCSGTLVPTAAGGELAMQIVGNGVPLEDELRDALQPQMRQLWNDLKPRGSADVVVDVHYWPGPQQLDVKVRAFPNSRNTSIEPAYFPYRMERLEGALYYENGQVRLDHLRGWHGSVCLTAVAGGCNFLPDGGWNFHLDDLTIDRLGLDRDLIPALPPRLRRALTDLSFNAPVDLRGRLAFNHGGRPSDLLQSEWNVRVGFQRGSLDCGLKLDNLHGEIGLAGACNGESFHTRGELADVSLNYKDLQLTQINGPFWIDDQRMLLGSWIDRFKAAPAGAAPAEAAARPGPITANLFGGKVYGDGRIVLGALPRYQFEATVSQADLADCARQLGAGRQNLSGKIMAKVELRGAGRSIDSLEGQGRLSLRDANIYQLPLMLSLLSYLSVREPDTKAFSQSDVEFRLQGNNIYLDRVDFTGDAISLMGDGLMWLDSRIQLTFHALVGRGQHSLPFVRDLMGGASQQLMCIRVDGTLQDPQVHEQALPMVNKALELLK